MIIIVVLDIFHRHVSKTQVALQQQLLQHRLQQKRQNLQKQRLSHGEPLSGSRHRSLATNTYIHRPILLITISFRSGRQSSGKLYFHPADVIPPGPDFHFQVSFDEDDDIDIDIDDIDIDSRMIRKDIFNGDNRKYDGKHLQPIAEDEPGPDPNPHRSPGETKELVYHHFRHHRHHHLISLPT